MKKKLNEIASYIKNAKTINETVSSATIGWHLHHALQIINGVCLTLMRSKEEDYSSKFNLKKTFVLLTGAFPRGKVKAPKATNKIEEITVEEIEKQLANTYKLLDKIEKLGPKSHFKHPLFGKLNLKESKKFFLIHTEHHLKIIRDILK